MRGSRGERWQKCLVSRSRHSVYSVRERYHRFFFFFFFNFIQCASHFENLIVSKISNLNKNKKQQNELLQTTHLVSTITNSQPILFYYFLSLDCLEGNPDISFDSQIFQYASLKSEIHQKILSREPSIRSFRKSTLKAAWRLSCQGLYAIIKNI